MPARNPYLEILQSTIDASIWMLPTTGQRQQVERKIFEFKDNGADSLSKPLNSQLYRMFKDLIHMNEI